MDVKENLAKIEKEIDASIKKSAHSAQPHVIAVTKYVTCLLYTSDAADDTASV